MQAKKLSPVPFCADGYSHFPVLGEFFDYTKYTNTSRAHYDTIYFVRIKMHILSEDEELIIITIGEYNGHGR